MNVREAGDYPPRVLHVTGRIGKASFGLGQVAVNLAKAESDLGADVHIWCLDEQPDIEWAVALPGLSPARVRSFSCRGPARLAYSPGMISAAKSVAGVCDVVHQHGIWTACSRVSNTLRTVHRVPTVVAPHGSLQEWALSRSTWNKYLASLAYERRNLHEAACLHATGEAEVSDCRDHGLVNPIALIPNGISERWLESEGDGTRFRQRHAIPEDRRILLFLSRITPKKGLPILLEAIGRVRHQFSDWLLVIAGSDERGHLDEVRSLATSLGLEEYVAFTGPLFDQAKRDAFAGSDAFVLPSYSEGSPMVVLDALATGIPVITTEGTPWQELSRCRCGWCVKPSPEGIATALIDLVGMTEEQRRAMGARGRELARSRYLWVIQGRKALALYAWLLGRSEKPDFVITD